MRELKLNLLDNAAIAINDLDYERANSLLDNYKENYLIEDEYNDFDDIYCSLRNLNEIRGKIEFEKYKLEEGTIVTKQFKNQEVEYITLDSENEESVTLSKEEAILYAINGFHAFNYKKKDNIRFIYELFKDHEPTIFNKILGNLENIASYLELRETHEILKSQNELYFQKLMKENIDEIFEGKYTLDTERKDNPKHRVDIWLTDSNGVSIPVEMKLWNFNKSALEQLQRYMKFYKCDKGIAVARALKVELPKNIEFINLSTLDKYNEMKLELAV